MLFALRGLTSKLAARLFGRGVAARALELTFRGAPSGVSEGDGEGEGSGSAACGDAVGEAPGEGGGNVVARVRVELPSALHRAEDLFAVVRARLGSLRLRAPVRSLALAADLLAPRMDSSGHLFQAFDRGEAALPRVLGELEAHHGVGSVGFLQVAEAWRPDDRSRLVPASARPNGTSAPRAAESFPLLQPFEPLRVFARPVPVEPLEVVAPYMHLEGAEWWRYGDEALVLEAAKGGEGVVALVERGEGAREGAGTRAAAAALAANENAGVHAGSHEGAAHAHPQEKLGVMRLWGWFG
jgi:protein ImuB